MILLSSLVLCLSLWNTGSLVDAADRHPLHLYRNTLDDNAPMGWTRLQQRLETSASNVESETLRAGQGFNPGQPAQPFQLHTLDGLLEYPSSKFSNSPIIIHTFDNHSAFLESLWTSKNSVESLLKESPDNAHFVFIPTSEGGVRDAMWMKGQLQASLDRIVEQDTLGRSLPSSLSSRFHFAVTSVYQLGNWIPALLQQWACQDHGCGLPQVVFQSQTSKPVQMAGNRNAQSFSAPIILKRLDARYDWLPSPAKFGNQTIPVASSKDGCQPDNGVAKRIAVVTAGGCSFSKKISTMQQSQAVAVIVYAEQGHPVQDMNCEGAECDTPPSIPATMVPYSQDLMDRLLTDKMYVSFQTTPTEAFYFGIDGEGLLQEIGWLLYPSFQFFNWQAEWFNYASSLKQRLSTKALVLPIFKDKVMHGETGVVASVTLPPLERLSEYNKLELDASLSCPGTRDETCPPWDHIVGLYLCCNGSSPLCNMELGRWITPFRRRIGHWLTDVSPLFPLLTSNKCKFTMKTVPWAAAWKPSLNLRLSKDSTKGTIKPYNITPLFQGGTFNSSYNKIYKPYYFAVPSDAKKVQVYAVITGHGSDNNGCGEFCVTSHHFVVNGHPNNITFSNAGTPLGCALRTPTGVEPNEHGTWLYGRDGWCDGREVDPWVFDITSQLTTTQNKITYFGWFEGKDPNPTSNPGYIVMYSYLVFYK